MPSVQDGGVQIVDADALPWLPNSRSKVGRAALHAAAGQPGSEAGCDGRVPWRFATRVRPNSPLQTTSVSSSSPRRFRSFSNAAMALVAGQGVLGVVGDVPVVVPGLSAAVVQLHHPDATLDQPGATPDTPPRTARPRTFSRVRPFPGSDRRRPGRQIAGGTPSPATQSAIPTPRRADASSRCTD